LPAYLRLIIIPAFILICLTGAEASLIKIPEDFTVIQDAIDAAISGDTIMATAGIYKGDGNRNLNFGGKALTLISESGSDETIIDCDAGYTTGSFRGFIFENGEDSSSQVIGFTIRNGGLLGIGYEPSGGAGIYIYNASPFFFDCIFENNIIDPGGKKLTAVVTDELSGGAVLCDSAAAPQFFDCVFQDNAVWHGGGAVYCYMASPLFDGCLFVDNYAFRGPGAAILCDSLSMPEIVSCTFAGNFVERGEGAGIGCRSGSRMTIDRTIIAFNINGEAVYCDTSGFADISCSNVYGNGGGDWIGCIEGQVASYGNMYMDPGFCDALLADFHISLLSPCLPENNECSELVGALDMGCLGFLCGDVSGNDIINILDVTYLISFLYKNGPAPPVFEAADCNQTGNIDILDITYLIEYLYRAGPDPVCQ